MLTALLLLHSLAAPAAPAAARGGAADPPVKVWFSSDGKYLFGDRAKVYARTAEDGYLVVLRADASSVGKYKTDDAKMIGMTPAWFTLSGM